VIDAHLHVWGAELLDREWLNEARTRPIRQAFSLDDAATMLRHDGLAGAVVVGADESDAGTARLLADCAGRDVVAAVVGWTDLEDARAPARIAALRAAPGGELLRGIRLVVGDAAAAPVSDALRASLAALCEAGLVLEVLVSEAGLERVARLCGAAPGLTVVVDHLGGPEPDGDRARWRRRLATFAEHPGAFAKVSGAAVQADDVDVLVQTARAELGAARLMAGTDWPVSLLGEQTSRPWPRIAAAVRDWTDAERFALLGGTAVHAYGLTRHTG
jgi:L-fuconolactonase